jgi:hypothetical protein
VASQDELSLCFEQLLIRHCDFEHASLSSMNICDSETGDGCGVFFSRKVSPGLCAKCTKLATLVEGSPEYVQWKVRIRTSQFIFF